MLYLIAIRSLAIIALICATILVKMEICKWISERRSTKTYADSRSKNATGISKS